MIPAPAGDISGELAERFHHSDTVLRVPHLHPNMKTLNWHRHGSICTSPANSATCQRPTLQMQSDWKGRPLLHPRYGGKLGERETLSSQLLTNN